MNKFCLVITDAGEAASAMSLLKLDPAAVTALVVGTKALAEEVTGTGLHAKWINTESAPAENYAESAAEHISALSPAAVIGVASAGSRAIIGCVAAKGNAGLVPNLTAVCAEGEELYIEHAIYSDKMIEELTMPQGACLLINPFSLPSVETDGKEDESLIEAISAESTNGIELIATEAVQASLLQNADIIVGVGLGCSGEEAFSSAKVLAEKLGAELGCSMPVYNELGLLPHERYIGISGTKIAPKMYFALGISGTSQHCAGVRNSKTIVCINKDPKALFFDNADYGIVGDINELLPKLTAALG